MEKSAHLQQLEKAGRDKDDISTGCTIFWYANTLLSIDPKQLHRSTEKGTPGSCENTWQSRTLNAHTRIRKINLGFDNRVSTTIFVICIVANGLRIIFRSSLCGDVLFGTTLSQGVNRIALNSIPKDQYQMRVTLQPYQSLTSLTVIQAGMLRWPDGWRHLLFFRYSNTLCASRLSTSALVAAQGLFDLNGSWERCDR